MNKNVFLFLFVIFISCNYVLAEDCALCPPGAANSCEDHPTFYDTDLFFYSSSSTDNFNAHVSGQQVDPLAQEIFCPVDVGALSSTSGKRIFDVSCDPGSSRNCHVYAGSGEHSLYFTDPSGNIASCSVKSGGCGANEMCVLKMIGTENAHVASCDSTAVGYDNYVCCVIGEASDCGDGEVTGVEECDCGEGGSWNYPDGCTLLPSCWAQYSLPDENTLVDCDQDTCLFTPDTCGQQVDGDSYYFVSDCYCPAGQTCDDGIGVQNKTLYRWEGFGSSKESFQLDSNSYQVYSLASRFDVLYASDYNGGDGRIWEFDGSENWDIAQSFTGFYATKLSVTSSSSFLYATGNNDGPDVWRYDGTGWENISSDDGFPSEATGIWGAGSLSANSLHIGTDGEVYIYRLIGGGTWTGLGQVGSANRVYALINYGGVNYAGTGDTEAKVYYYNLGNWEEVGTTGPTMDGDQVLSLGEYNNELYAGIHTISGGKVYRYDEPIDTWEDTGEILGDAVVSLIEFGGHLYAGTYDASGNARVYSYGGDSWEDASGDLGNSDYVWDLIEYPSTNGDLYASTGTDTDAKVYRFIKSFSQYTPVSTTSVECFMQMSEAIPFASSFFVLISLVVLVGYYVLRGKLLFKKKKSLNRFD